MPLEGQFYEEDVQHVTVPDDALFFMEQIVQHRGTQVEGSPNRPLPGSVVVPPERGIAESFKIFCRL